MASELSQLKKPIHFFKIIVTQSLHQEKLMIPRKFVKKYGEYLPKAICIKTPNGADWKISIVKNDGNKWFEKGWKEFAEYHSLSHGHLLVFKYETTSHFEVRIFDKSALEINYPFKRVEVNNEEDCRATQKRKSYSSFEIGSTSCVKVVKSQKVAAACHTHKKYPFKRAEVNNDEDCRVSQKRKAYSSFEIGTTSCVKKDKGNTALERAEEFKTCNPSFVVVMGASYVGGRFLLAHFDMDKEKGYIYFQVLDHGLVWPAKYSTCRRCNGRIMFEVTSGWKEFSMDNSLKVGDVCKFELILRTNMTFHVHIFRNTNEVNADCSTTSANGIIVL
ncbi:B3 domain-containing transcription factor VRN1-like isoform X2 [Vicia villosa]|uniref:B3 domain-containing transcription factor VRN1-like isoform X2 n=1 Tax=Vicia villosa TaxID=3911 RepID=UPI00273CB9A7|nr:B3 domain-containing transcription factor VRN1-like isoform X2 [Vicia villosa]